MSSSIPLSGTRIPLGFQLMTCSFRGDSNIAAAGYGMEYPSYSLDVHSRCGYAACTVSLARRVRLVVGHHYHHDEVYLLNEGLAVKSIVNRKALATGRIVNCDQSGTIVCHYKIDSLEALVEALV